MQTIYASYEYTTEVNRSKFITHLVPDIYPAWDPGTVLYKLKRSIEENTSWCISAEQLVLVAKLLLDGRYPVKRVVTVTQSNDKKPHISIIILNWNGWRDTMKCLESLFHINYNNRLI